MRNFISIFTALFISVPGYAGGSMTGGTPPEAMVGGSSGTGTPPVRFVSGGSTGGGTAPSEAFLGGSVGGGTPPRAVLSFGSGMSGGTPPRLLLAPGSGIGGGTPPIAEEGLMNGILPEELSFDGGSMGGTPPEYDYNALAPLLEAADELRLEYPDANPEELDEILKERINAIRQINRSSLLEIEDGSDIEYSDIVDTILPASAQLNDAERLLFNGSPFQGLAVINAGRKAYYTANDLYLPQYLHNQNGDAFRHCFWNNLMVAATSQDFARAWADAHEEKPGNPVIEKTMDIRNNFDGRRLAFRYPDESDEQRKTRCLTGVDGKRLVRIVNGELAPTDATGKK